MIIRRPFVIPVWWGLLQVLCLLQVAESGYAQTQTRLDLRSQTKSVDFSGASSTRPFRAGTTLPASCTAGEAFFKTDNAPGNNIYFCAAGNTWVPSGVVSGTAQSRPSACLAGQIYASTDTGAVTYCSAAGNPGTWSPFLTAPNGDVTVPGSVTTGAGGSAAGSLVALRGTGTARLGVQGATAGEWDITAPSNFSSWSFTPPAAPCGLHQWWTTSGTGVGNCTQPAAADLSDVSNVPLKNGANVFTAQQTDSLGVSLGADCVSQTYAVGSGTVAARTLVALSAGQAITAVAGGGPIHGIAKTGAAAGGNIEVCIAGSALLQMDGTAAADRLAVAGTGAGGYGHDSGQTSAAGVSSATGVIGNIVAGCSGVGCTATVNLQAPGQVGASSSGGASPGGSSGDIQKNGGGGTLVAADANSLSGPASCQDAGSTDSYTCSFWPAITAYATGTEYRFKANTANTGAASIAFNGLAAVTIKKPAGGIATDLVDNDIRAGQWVDVIYNGTNMQMTGLLGNAAAGGGGGAAMTAGTGYLTPFSTTALQGTSYSANTTYFFQFSTPYTIPAASFGLFGNAASTSVHLAMALMDKNCNKLAGTDSNITGIATGGDNIISFVPQTNPYSLAPGEYYFAIAADGNFVLEAGAETKNMMFFLAGTSAPRNFTGSAPTGSGATLAIPSSCGAKSRAGDTMKPALYILP